MISHKIGKLSEKGKKSTNEDGYLAISLPENKYNILCILAVADGMGGKDVGEYASNIAVDIFQRTFLNHIYQTDSKGNQEESIENFMYNAFNTANKVLIEQFKSKSGDSISGTTLTAAAITADVVHLMHAGDSSLYTIDSTSIAKKTKDDSKGKALTNYIGKKGFTIDYQCLPLERNSALILCTDGITDVLTQEELHTMYLYSKGVHEACADIISEAIKKNARDNMTIIVYEHGIIQRKQRLVEPIPRTKRNESNKRPLVSKRLINNKITAKIIAVILLFVFISLVVSIIMDYRNEKNKLTNPDEIIGKDLRLYSPADSSETAGKVKFIWSFISKKSEYNIIISDSSNLLKVVFTSTVKDTVLTTDFSNQKPGNYYWQVSAIIPAGNGLDTIKSDVREFRVISKK